MSVEYEPWVDQWPEAVDAVMEFWPAAPPREETREP